MHRKSLRLIEIRPRAGDRLKGWLIANHVRIPVALGRSGIRANKREGDGATPRGRFRLLRLWWRADRFIRPITLLPVRPIKSSDAWCENPNDRRYNQPFSMSLDQEGDRLWREDHLYDFIIELDHNTRPRISGRGSAVFIHIARPGLLPTAGCVAMELRRLRWLLAALSRNCRVVIQ